MFTSSRYITKGINEEISLESQIFLWNLIDELAIDKDYLQVFEICKRGDGVVRVVHKQEVPYFRKEYFLNMQSTSSTIKIFVIDSGTYSMMMLANEY